MKHRSIVIVRIFCVAVFAAAGVFAQGDLVLRLDMTTDNALSAAIAKVAEEAYQLNMKGLDALEKKDNVKALEFFAKALSAFPQYSDAMNNRGVALYRRGDVSGARRAWEETVKSDPQYHVAYYNLGLILLHEKKTAEARRQFELALKHNKKFTEAILRLGVLQLQAGNTAAAVAEFGKAYKGDPKHSDAWNFYSYGLLMMKDTAQAVTVLKSVGNNADALAQLGRVEASRRRYAEAAVHLAKAVELGAGASVVVDLATAHVDAGNCKGALAVIDGHLAKEPKAGVDAWLLAGYAARDCYGVKRALEYYERGLTLHPREPLLTYNAGYMHFAQKDYARAESVWSGVGESFSDPSLYYMRAVAARSRGDLSSAEAHIRKAISMDEKAEYHDYLGVILGAKGNGKAAEEHFRRALKIDPGHTGAQLNLAVVRRTPAELDKAAGEASKKFSECRGGCTDAAMQLSILQYHQKKLDAALKTLESLPDKDKDIRVYRHAAAYYKEMQRFDRAVASLEAAAAKFPSDMKARYELAEAYLSAGSPGKAAAIFEGLLPKWKENVWRLHYQLGYAYMEMNDLTKAKGAFEKSLALKKDNPAARGLLAFVLNRMGETAQALDQWEKTVKEDGGNAAVHINLGLSYEGKGEYGKALESYWKAHSLDPKDKAIHINLGNAYRGLERYSEAYEAYRLGMESDKREEALYNTFLLARKQGDRSRAERMFEQLKREFPKSRHLSEVAAEWELDKKAAEAKRAFDKGDFRAAFTLYREVIGASRGKSAEAYMHNAVLAAHKGGMHREAMSAASDYSKRVSASDRVEIVRLAGGSAAAAKDWKEAKAWFTQLSGMEQKDALAHYNLAVAHYNLGEVESAYDRYQRARKLDGSIYNKDIEVRYEQRKGGGQSSAKRQAAAAQPNDSLEAWYNEAVDLQNAKKTDQAEALYNKILELDKNFSQAWNNLGAIHGARGDLELAVAAYQNALRNEIAPETYANLANVYVAMEDRSKARDIIKQGLEKNPNNRMLTRLQQQMK